MVLAQKRERLESSLQKLGSALVAFSGGVDSTLVLAVAHSVLGKNVLAVTAQSESLPQRELEQAARLARTLGVDHKIIATYEASSPDYLKNPVNRCYFCKSELYDKLSSVASEHKLAHILNGVNKDDLGDHRPGIFAGKEAGVLSPLADAGFNKQDVRDLAKKMGLPNWKKPAMACLSSRVPYGEAITMEKLAVIEQAEGFLYSLGFNQLRVRHHGDIARIELPQKDISRFMEKSVTDRVQQEFKKIGFKFIAVDIEGFRSGRMNESIKKNGDPSSKPE